MSTSGATDEARPIPVETDEELGKSLELCLPETLRKAVQSVCPAETPLALSRMNKANLIQVFCSRALDDGVAAFVEKLTDQVVVQDALKAFEQPTSTKLSELHARLRELIRDKGLPTVLGQCSPETLTLFSNVLGLTDSTLMAATAQAVAATPSGTEDLRNQIVDEVMLTGTEKFLKSMPATRLRELSFDLGMGKTGSKRAMVEKLMCKIFDLEPVPGTADSEPQPDDVTTAATVVSAGPGGGGNSRSSSSSINGSNSATSSGSSSSNNNNSSSSAASTPSKNRRTPDKRAAAAVAAEKPSAEKDSSRKRKRAAEEAVEEASADDNEEADDGEGDDDDDDAPKGGKHSAPASGSKPKKRTQAEINNPNLSDLTLIKPGISKDDLQNNYYQGDLVRWLKENGHPSSGKKAQLIVRVCKALAGEGVAKKEKRRK